jgi:hypothetical protein
MAKWLVLALLGASLGGCGVTAVVGAAASVVGAAVDVTGSVVSGTVDVVSSGVSGAIDLAASDKKSDAVTGAQFPQTASDTSPAVSSPFLPVSSPSLPVYGSLP